ncbi:unnamed protein product [Adineta steineri]|uniref:Uncharacterized protein n=1 Tax=Adineta steineri TaxID=433720 RepID=A0A818MHY5_9BILA|nr:unnamed protein product [Adineta steineri]
MLFGRFLLIIIFLSTFIFAANTTTNNNHHLISSPTITNVKSYEKTNLFSIPIQSSSSAAAAANKNECQVPCSIDYCLKYQLINKNCSKLIRDPCDCCTVCLRTENQVCGGHLNVYGLCEQDLLCYKSNKTINNFDEPTGICVKACLKFQCLSIMINNTTTCECSNRRVPCKNEFSQNIVNDNKTYHDCMQESISQQKRELSSLKAHDVNDVIDCSNIICNNKSNNSSICPLDSHFIEDHIPLLQTSSSSKNLSLICCQPRGQCICSLCPKTICGENSIIQIYRTGNPNIPGQCCDQFSCIKNSKQCYHDKKIYSENETWSVDHCTTCTCREGLVDCTMVQCPTYTHCGYMYKPENECCPKCGGCLNDRLHVQHMNSTWIESNGCMRCWCEEGRSRCIADGCIAPPCENPRQIENVCCPVCDDFEDQNRKIHNTDSRLSSQSPLTTNKCPLLEKCLLECEHGLAKDEQGCLLCACSTMSCPSPLCTLKFDRSLKQFCSCISPNDLNCGQLNCDKHCPYNYLINKITGCLTCECNPCPTLTCTKNCTYGLRRNEVGCPICVCESNIIIHNDTLNTDLLTRSRFRQCYSGQFSYSNGEIWFDGCRQCLCHKGEPLCALISCPTPTCSHPIILPNRCCPSCPEITMLPEPIPSSQVCYASQYVTGEELEFDKCTKCICLHNIAFCSISLCPPLSCSSPINDSSLCCPICPSKTSELQPITDLSTVDEDICLLENGIIKPVGEWWKHNDCQSCLCPRGGGGQVQCFSQTCDQNLPCSNPVLKKGQCCPFCLPPTAAVSVCIFNYVQYRSGEHWNVSDCHRCKCLYGTIVCHQHQCPSLSCVHAVTLSGHCCPICRDQLPFLNDQDKLPISQSRFGLTIIITFSILILILILVIIILIFILLRGTHRSISSSNQLPTIHHHRLPRNSHHHPTGMNSKPTNLFSYVKYDLMSISNDNTNSKQGLSSSGHIPLSSLEQTSTHSMIGTNTTTTGTSSSNNELEPGTWTEDDVMLHCSASSCNDDDDDDDDEDDDEQEMISSDTEESHQQQSSQPHIHMITGPPTIIYV